MTEVADINIRELASLAGVSIATVSRVINNPQLVQPDTREHVLGELRAGLDGGIENVFPVAADRFSI